MAGGARWHTAAADVDGRCKRSFAVCTMYVHHPSYSSCCLCSAYGASVCGTVAVLLCCNPRHHAQRQTMHNAHRTYGPGPGIWTATATYWYYINKKNTTQHNKATENASSIEHDEDVFRSRNTVGVSVDGQRGIYICCAQTHCLLVEF